MVVVVHPEMRSSSSTNLNINILCKSALKTVHLVEEEAYRILMSCLC